MVSFTGVTFLYRADWIVESGEQHGLTSSVVLIIGHFSQYDTVTSSRQVVHNKIPIILCNPDNGILRFLWKKPKFSTVR